MDCSHIEQNPGLSESHGTNWESNQESIKPEKEGGDKKERLVKDLGQEWQMEKTPQK